MNNTQFNWPDYHPDDPTHRLIAAYLTIDIQKSPEAIVELLEKINAVNSGEISDWERIGNAYYLRILPNHVEIEENFSEEPGKCTKIPIPLFQTAAQFWQYSILLA